MPAPRMRARIVEVIDVNRLVASALPKELSLNTWRKFSNVGLKKTTGEDENAWLPSLKAVLIIHRIGPRKISVTSRAATPRAMLRRRWRRRRAPVRGWGWDWALTALMRGPPCAA